MSIIVKVHNGYFYAGKEHVPVDGQVTVIPARTSASYELIEQLTGKSPQSIKVEKRGKDIALSVDEDDTADIIISDFFLHPDSQIVGLGNDGSYYSYLPDQSEFENLFGKEFSTLIEKKLNPLTWYDKYFGEEQGAQPGTEKPVTGMKTVGLYSYGKTAPWLLDAQSEPMGDLLKPVLGAIGLSGLVMLGIENAKTEDKPTSTTANPPKRPTAEINDEGTQVTGNAEAGSTVRVFNGTTELASATTGSDGKYSITLSNTPSNGERLLVNAVKNGSGPSQSATVNAPDTTKPEKATEVKVNDDGTEVTGKAEAGATVKVLDEFNNALGSAQADREGNFSVKLLVPQTTEQPLKVSVLDSKENTSDTVDLKGVKGKNTVVSQPKDIDISENVVKEDAKVGTTVGITVKSTDYEKVTYTLTNDADGKFKIDANSGVVTLASSVDFESVKSHQITARATSADGSLREQQFTVKVSNVNDNKVSSITDSDTATNSVSANVKLGEKVGITAKATDSDGDKVTYSLTDNASGKFSINADTGEVLVAKDLSKDTGSVNIKVKATSADGSTSEKDFSVSIDAVTQSRPINLSALEGDAETQMQTVQSKPVMDTSTPVDTLMTADNSQLLVVDYPPIL